MKKLTLYFLVFALLGGISSCVKDKFDAPPAGGVDPDLTVNFSINDLKARLTGTIYQMNEDRIISAIVVGDDKSGNLYKTIAIQDSTGGIMLTLDGSYLYNNYPVGRRLFIKLKGLYVVKYKGLYEIVASVNPDGTYTGIPSSVYDQYIFPGKWGLTVTPKVVTINQLNDSYQSELIELDNVEFQSADAGQPYANGATLTSQARYIQDCNGNSIEVYTSGYADFANSLTPRGNGKLLAIYGVYNTYKQLTVRDTTDVDLNGINCNGQHGGGGNSGIAAVRALYTGSPVVLPQGTSVTGVVISDLSTGNINSKNLVLQDSTGGILIRFSATHSFAVGAQITVDLSGDSLYPYRGWLEVTPVPIGNAQQTGTGTITPRQVTIADINANLSAWESTLVKISGCSFAGSGTYSGNVTLNDGTASGTLYTSSSATFASTAYPTSTATVTCIIEQYNGLQLQIRNTTDVQ
ncbi:MAG TPA: DUF5689 domain-containing protein [Chitinophagales bacterium]|nr:DUF5689 domain-containing protein [Chitinophagales bacterium]